MISAQPPHEPSFQDNPGRRLSALTDQEQELVYLAALPLWLDRDILLVLYESRDRAQVAVRLLERLFILTRVTKKRAVIRPEARRYLLRTAWRSRQAMFARQNSRLAAYCVDMTSSSEEASTRFRWAQAAMFHLLAAGDAAGWDWLAHLFDGAEARGLIGTAQQVLLPLRDLRPFFNVEERALLAYYRARAALMAGQLRQAAGLFRAIISVSQSDTLLGLAHRGLGQTLGRQQRWSEGQQHLRQSRRILEKTGDKFSLALTWLSIGNLYRELAEFSGGIAHRENQSPSAGQAGLVRFVFYLPVHAYHWLAQTIQRTPFIDVGYNYQNWLTARILLAAIAAYRRAERHLQGVDSPQTLYEIRLGLVGVYLGVGMLRRANHLLDWLKGWKYVQESEFRRAFVMAWQAELYRRQGNREQASTLLRRTLEIYQTLHYQRGLALACERLGDLESQSGNIETAREFYGRAAVNYAQTQQPLSRTRALDRMDELDADRSITEAASERVYLVRFPDLFARLYQFLAFGVTFVLLIVILVIIGAGLLLTAGIESDLALGIINVAALGLVLAWPLVGAWLFQLVYLFFGLGISSLLPLRLLERDPPVRITLRSAEIAMSASGRRPAVRLSFESRLLVQVVDYMVRNQPIELFSHIDLVSPESRSQIPAFTTGYEQLRSNLRQRLTSAQWKQLPFRLIASRNSYILGIVAALLGGVLFQQVFQFGVTYDIHDPTRWQPAAIAGILLGAVATGFVLFPLVTFGRLILHLRKWRRDVPPDYPRPPIGAGSILVYLGTGLWTAMALLYVLWSGWVLLR